MTGYEVYTFLICLFVGLLLGVVLLLMLSNIYKSTKKIISLGGQDEQIIKEKKIGNKKRSVFGLVLEYGFSGLMAVLCFSFLIFALVSTPMDINQPVSNQVAQVVKSSSMSYKNEANEYLFEHNLNDQFDTFDLVFVTKLPKESELKLYDIVVYESNDKLIIHRIIDIEEPNEFHSTCRYFKTQGDANDTHDKFPVLYSQMRGIYTGEHIPFIGSFILFIQSYPGYLCIGLIIGASIFIPIFENRLDKHKNDRYLYLLENNLIQDDEIISLIDRYKIK